MRQHGEIAIVIEQSADWVDDSPAARAAQAAGRTRARRLGEISGSDMLALFEAGVAKALGGTTSFEEVRRGLAREE